MTLRDNSKLTRRRFLSVAATAAVGLIPTPSFALNREVRWRGVALGAQAEIRLVSPDEGHARRVLAECRREIERLEDILSLYRPHNTLVRLNRDGSVDDPELELVEVLSTARQVSDATGGAFDVSVQPLWQLFADHFAEASGDPAGPDNRAIAKARGLVDYRRIDISPRRIALATPGMALTLNGIAQGFVTDRIARLLKREGFADVLVDIGEISGHGRNSAGRPWRTGIADPENPEAVISRAELADCSIATSAPSGFRFRPGSPINHLFDPHSGRSAGAWRSVSVIASSATVADAFSTAFSLMERARIETALRSWPGLRVILYSNDGRIVELSSIVSRD